MFSTIMDLNGLKSEKHFFTTPTFLCSIENECIGQIV